MSLGARLREARIRQAVSLNDLAVRAGLSSSYVAEVEAGYAVPSYETLEIWARALEVPFYRLFFSRPEAALTPRLDPRLRQDGAPRPARVSIFRTLKRWMVQGLNGTLGEESTSEQTYHD